MLKENSLKVFNYVKENDGKDGYTITEVLDNGTIIQHVAHS